MSKLKILFIGTGEFGVPILEALLSDPGVEVVGVVTQPDKPVGREQIIEGGPVKQFINRAIVDSRNQEIRIVFQPEILRAESEQILSETKPELIVVAAYGQMIPDDMLAYPQYGCINLHGSLLPFLRGAVPVPIAILNGFHKTGVTIQRMVKELDAGPVIVQEETEILPTDTTESLKHRLAGIAKDLLLRTIPGIVDGTVSAWEQDESKATYCRQSDISKDNAEIRFGTTPEMAERMVRAFYPWPIAWFSLQIAGEHKRIKIFEATVPQDAVTGAGDVPHQVVRRGKKLFLVLHDGALELEELQLEGKQRKPASEYLFLAVDTMS